MVEWEAYHFFEPFGPPAEDDRWRIHYMLQWNFGVADKTAQMPDWLDRDPEETARRRRVNDLLTMEDEMDSFFSSLAARAEPDDSHK